MRAFLLLLASVAASIAAPLTLLREGNMLIIRGDRVTGGEIKINYLEAYCRAGSTDADWVKHTVIKHRSETLAANDREVRLRDTLEDGGRYR